MTVLPAQTFLRDCTVGTVKFGYNGAVGASSEDIWSYGGAYNWMAAASVLKVSSDSASDAAAGTGVNQLVIEGVDGSYLPVKETITLTGTSQVTTSSSFFRINRAYAAGTPGSNGTNVGNIYIYTGTATAGVPNDTTKIYGYIGADRGQTLQAIYTTAVGYQWAGGNFIANVGKSTNTVGIDIYIRTDGGPWRTIRLHDTVQQPIVEKLDVMTEVPAKTDIRVSATSSAGSQSVSAIFEIFGRPRA